MRIDPSFIRHWAYLFESEEQRKNGSYSFLSEGKHWPKDYVKTAVNYLKDKAGCSDSEAQKLADELVEKFGNLAHQNRNLGFYMPLVRWMAEYAGGSGRKMHEFLDNEADRIVSVLKRISADKSFDSRREEIKKMSLAEFRKLQDEVLSKKGGGAEGVSVDGEYEVVPILSYEELFEKYGGSRTGYDGDSEWCHTNGDSTYDSWTEGGTKMFFVVERKGWQKIKAPDPETVESAYDDYGMSLIAILVRVEGNEFLKSTLRWNHVVLPASGDADKAFEDWEEMNNAVGIDVEAECRTATANLEDEIRRRHEEANRRLAEKLRGVRGKLTKDDMDVEDRDVVTDVKIPDGVTSIG